MPLPVLSWAKKRKDRSGTGRGLFTSVPFDAYLLMTVLSLLGVSLPGPITEFVGFLGKAKLWE